MTNPTVNRAYTMPASTDLVTDLPADFAVFGDAVDLDISSRGGYTTTATAAGTTTLTVTSNRNQRFTGVTTQTVTMPVASTLAVGARWVIQNKSTGIVTVQSSGANTIYAIPAGTTAEFVCVLASGTTAASWDYDWAGATAAPGGGGLIPIYTTDSGGAVASLSINDVFSATYRNYKVLVNYTGSAVAQLSMRLRVGGADNTTASSYITQVINPNSTSLTAQRTTSDIATIGIYSNLLKSALEINFYNPFAATATPFDSLGYGGSDVDTRYFTGIHNVTTSYTGFSLIGGTFTVDKITVYGLKEA